MLLGAVMEIALEAFTLLVLSRHPSAPRSAQLSGEARLLQHHPRLVSEVA